MSDKNYKPENPVYEIPEQYEAYPHELNFGGATSEEAIKNAMEQLIAEPTKDTARRCLDEVEITTMRNGYTTLLENDKPAAESILETLLAEDACLKEKIKAQREILCSLSQQVNDKIKIIKEGSVYEPLDASSSMRVAVDSRYLYYTLAGGRFILAKVEEIPAKDQGGLFTRQTKNQEVFIRMFGCDFTPSDLFEQVNITKRGAKALTGRKLAAAARKEWTEDFVDEDSGEVVSIAREQEIIARDTEIDADDIQTLLDENVESVVLYKIKDAEAVA